MPKRIVIKEKQEVFNPVEVNPLDAMPERRIRAHAAQLGGAPGAEVSGLETAGVGDRIRYQNGTIYAIPGAEPAWVHGAIEARYNSFGGSQGWLGLPRTDELGTPDGRGRYNHFEHGSIYWTPTTGAFEVHGAIRDKWSELGWETGFLGYPLSDESPAPAGPGRFNVFEGGSVFWTPAAGAFELHERGLPASVTGHGDLVFGDGIAAGGSADIVLNADGSFTFSGHLHDSGAADYADSVVCAVVVKSTKTAYIWPHDGKMYGTFTPGDRNDDWTDTGTRQELVDAWTDICAGYEVSFHAEINWNPDGWVETIKAIYPYVEAVVAML